MEKRFHDIMDKISTAIMIAAVIYFGGHILVALYRGLLTFP